MTIADAQRRRSRELMLYREAGDFKTTYPQDSQTFPIKFDRYRYYACCHCLSGRPVRHQ